MLLTAPQLLRRDRGLPGGIVVRGRGAARDIVVYRGRELLRLVIGPVAAGGHAEQDRRQHQQRQKLLHGLPPFRFSDNCDTQDSMSIFPAVNGSKICQGKERLHFPAKEGIL